MIWALFEIIIPLLVTFLLGLGMGWLLWRWRRRYITASEWHTHTEAANAATADLQSFRAQHDDMAQENSRLTATMKKMGDNLDNRKIELESQSKEKDELRTELSQYKARLGELENNYQQATAKAAEADDANAKIARLEKEAATANELKAKLEASESSVADLQAQASTAAQRDGELERFRNHNTELTAQLDDANHRIAELEKAKLQNAELEKSLTAATEKLAAAEQSQVHASDLETKLNSATMKLSDFDKTQSEVISLRSQLASANSKVEESEKATEKKVSQLEAQLRAANATVATTDKLVEELELQLKQAGKKVDESEHLKSQTEDLAKQVNDGRARSNEQSDELAKAKSRVAELEAKTHELTKQAEQSNAKLAELETLRSEKSALTSQLTEARSGSTDLESAREKNTVLEARLKEATDKAADSDQQRARIQDLERQLSACKDRTAKLQQAQQSASAQPVGAVQGLQSNPSVNVQSLTNDIEKRDYKIADLERELAEARQAGQGHGSAAPAVRTTGRWQDTGSWRKGVTKLGTPGSDHKDDLKVISGIGEKMEKLLNSFDIQSWEQLAALTDEEVQTVDDALAEFPGRIERDEWVLQAQEILANGHEPLDKKAKKQKKKSADKPAQAVDWRSGTTHFGTPGSSHRDDLKEINGIGPVLEKTLNDFGIQSWEQLAELGKEDVDKIDQAIAFPGRIEREEWVAQAKELVVRFPDRSERP
jgi:predicted flap endonuclease-1-like 5' DNA nuclease/uncharacterized protein YigA (DUF484 family)